MVSRVEGVKSFNEPRFDTSYSFLGLIISSEDFCKMVMILLNIKFEIRSPSKLCKLLLLQVLFRHLQEQLLVTEVCCQGSE